MSGARLESSMSMLRKAGREIRESCAGAFGSTRFAHAGYGCPALSADPNVADGRWAPARAHTIRPPPATIKTTPGPIPDAAVVAATDDQGWAMAHDDYGELDIGCRRSGHEGGCVDRDSMSHVCSGECDRYADCKRDQADPHLGCELHGRETPSREIED